MFAFSGTVCDFRLSYGRVLSKKSKIITVNRNKSQLWKVKSDFILLSIYMCKSCSIYRDSFAARFNAILILWHFFSEFRRVLETYSGNSR